MGDKSASRDLAIAQLAARQHGVVAHRQMLRMGLSRNAISKRARVGRLHPVHRGVYAVGHVAPSVERQWMAAVLACGDGAVLSHGSAAALWKLLRPISGPVDISIPSQSGRGRRAGIRVHRRRSLRPEHITRRFDIPVTTPARTIDDLSATLPPRLVRRATRQAQIRGLRLGPEVPRHRTRSDLEEDFLRICGAAGVPPPQVNVRVGRWTVDFLWPQARLAVEADSYLYHRGSVAFEDDHARDLDLRRQGYEVRRFDERQIDEEPAAVAADLAAAFSAPPAS